MSENKNRRPPPREIKGRLLTDRLKCLLETSLYSDCIIITEDETLKSHKFILTLASPLFERTFYGPFSSNEYPVHFPTRTMITILKYAYQQPLDKMTCLEAEHVLEAAEFFEMNGLQKICEESLKESK